MARQARVKSAFGTYHIVQKGGKTRNLFESDEDRDKFISILQKSQKKNGFKLHGFCILDENTYDLVIDVNGGDLSKIMKSINIPYAMYVQCQGKLFSDRYKSYELNESSDLFETKRMLQNRVYGKKATCYNRCYEEVTSKEPVLVDFDDCHNCITCIDTASDKLLKIAHEKGISLAELNHDKELRNALIKEFRRKSTLSMKNLGVLFGGISESSISKILNS